MTLTEKHLQLPEEKTDDDHLSNPRFVSKYGRHFAKHFLPKYCVGVKLAQQLGDQIRVEARVTTLAKLSKKTERFFLIPVDEMETWRKNVKLYTFMSGGL